MRSRKEQLILHFFGLDIYDKMTITFKTELFYLVYFKWNLQADAWKKYQANNLTSPSMLELGLGLGLGLSVVTIYLLFCMHLFCSIIWQQIMILWKDVSKRRLYKKINVTGDFKVKLYQMMIMQFSEMWSYLTSTKSCLTWSNEI